MTPTQKTVNEEEYNVCSSDNCTFCKKKFYIMDSGWSVTIAYECPHCGSLVKHKKLREARGNRPKCR